MTSNCRFLLLLALAGWFYTGCERHDLEETHVLYPNPADAHGHHDAHHDSHDKSHNEDHDHSHDKAKAKKDHNHDKAKPKTEAEPTKEEPRDLGL